MVRRAFIRWLLIIPVFTAAQTDDRRPAVVLSDSNTAALRFERNVNTYLWNAHAGVHVDDRDVMFLLRDHFTSSFIRGPFGSFRDEHTLLLRTSKRLSRDADAVADLHSFILSDRQALTGSSSGIHTVAAGIAVRPLEGVTVSPMAGMRFDQQQGRNDQGWNLRLSASGDSLESGGYRGSVNGQWNESDLGSRRFRNDLAQVRIATEFTEGSTDSVALRWALHRNDFYIPADSNVLNQFGTSSNIRSRTEESWGIQNFLAFRIGGGFTSILDVAVDSRTIRNAYAYKPLTVLSSIPFNTSVDEFRIDGGIRLEYLGASNIALIGFQMGQRNEQHRLERINGIDEVFQTGKARQESRLDNVAYRTALSASLISAFTDADTVSFNGSIGLLQYDTPDTVNTDDRDELMINGSATAFHRFSGALTASVTAEVTAAHLVYLSREKSANNNWNHIYRLSPAVHFRPSEQFRMTNVFEVQANYTAFDFEGTIPSVRSYSYRQVAFLDSTSYDMTRRVGVDLSAYVRIYERGELRWKEFAERPLQRIEEVTLSPQARYSPDERWSFAAGFRSFAQKRFSYSGGIRKYESTFLSAGPTTAVTIAFSAHSRIEIRGWKEFQRQSGGRIREFSNMTMNIRYIF